MEHVLSGLITKRTEIKSEYDYLTKKLSDMAEQIKTIDKTIKIFDPELDTSTIKEKRYKAKNSGLQKHEIIFTAMFLGWLRTVGFYEKIQDKSNGGGIKLPHLENWIKIPNFPDAKQKEIALKYYNTVESNKHSDLEKYLELEKQRNEQLGIWQLNMELFDLMDKMEDLVQFIILGNTINHTEFL